MRSKSAKYRNYTSKEPTYDEPTPTLQNAAFKMIVNNVNEWYELMNIRYYEHL